MKDFNFRVIEKINRNRLFPELSVHKVYYRVDGIILAIVEPPISLSNLVDMDELNSTINKIIEAKELPTIIYEELFPEIINEKK